MPAVSKAQQAVMGMALAARRGEMKVSELSDAALKIYKSDMTDKQIEDFASTSKEGLPKHKMKSLKESILSSTGTGAAMTEKFLNDHLKPSQWKKNDDGTYSVSMIVLNKKMDIGVFDSEEEAYIGFIDGKIDYICDLAEKCKGKVPDYVYEGMLNWKVEIAD